MSYLVDFGGLRRVIVAMPKSTLFFAAGLSGLVLLVLGFLQVRESSQAAAAATAEAEARTAQATALGITNATLSGELTTARALITELQQAVEHATKSKSTLESEFRAALESKDVTISELQGRLTVNILDRVLFDSGEAELKPEGEAVLAKVGQVLAQYPHRQFQVIGHTDNVPIRNRTSGGFTDNWSLSVGRALAAVRFLEKQAGVDSQRLAAVGCSEFRPLADNGTAEGRAHNRRIAIVVLPEEIGDISEKPARPAEEIPK